jgi:hypothetical protein
LKDDTFYLRYILECIHRVEEDTASGGDVFAHRELLKTLLCATCKSSLKAPSVCLTN